RKPEQQREQCDRYADTGDHTEKQSYWLNWKMFGNVRFRHKRAVIDSKQSRKRKLSFWGAHASGVLAIAFCDRELCWPSFHCLRALSKEKFVAAEWGDRHAASVRSPRGSLTRRVYASKLDHENQKHDLVSGRRSCDVHVHGDNGISNTTRSW